MQKFEILYNRAFSASTQESPNTVSSVALVAEEPLFQTQQNLSFQQEYFIYLQRNGVSLVNDLNVKGYLNNPNNEAVAREFIDYLSGTCSYYEFTDILYDNKKLSDYFNDYYRKFKTYSNQGSGSATTDSSINLNVTKSRVLNQDRLYAQTNSLTHYIVDGIDGNGQLVAKSVPTAMLPSDFSYFSGTDESYYVNIIIENGRKTFFSDDFSQYYQDCCDGTITYNKYTYLNSVSQNSVYGNYSALKMVQGQFNLSLGPSESSVNYMKSFLPVNFLYKSEVNNTTSASPIDPSTLAQISEFTNSYGYVTITQNNSGSDEGQILNFMNFSQFQEYFDFQYLSWLPQFQNPNAYRETYLYQQTVKTMPDQTNQIPLYAAGFEEVPAYADPQYQGQLFDKLNTNTYRIRVNHTTQAKPDTILMKWEPCSMGTLGADDGFNAVSFNVNGNVDPNVDSVTITFNASDLYQDVYINLYRNLPTRTPIVFSLRPTSKPGLILEYLVVYLEEFYEFKNYTSTDRINVTSFDMCKLMYNCFVDRNYNDNFLEFQRPDTIPTNFINTTGVTLQQTFDMANTAQVNSKLLNAFNNGALDLASIASVVRVPESGIYNIYIWGAHLFGTEDVYSDADLIVVADGQTPVRQVKDQGVDIAVYTPQRFQYELEEVVVKMLNESVSSDRVFTVYNSSDQNFKILERMSFLPNGSKDLIKRRAEEFKRERWKAVEEAFFMKDTQSWQKRLWSIFRNLIFLTQFVKDGKITDLNAPKVYLEEITSKRFNDYASLVTYFNPKVESLYSTLLSL
jgi:hypothetical protein